MAPPITLPAESHPYVTHGEFSQFREDVRGQFASIHSEFTSIKGSLDRMTSSIEKRNERLDQKITEAAEKNAPKATDWKGILGVAFGGFGVIVAFLAIYVRPIEAAMERHESLPGHPEAMELHAAYGERFETLVANIESNRDDIGEVEERFATWNYRLTEQHDQATTARAALSERVARLESRAIEWGDARQERHDLEARVRALEVRP